MKSGSLTPIIAGVILRSGSLQQAILHHVSEMVVKQRYYLCSHLPLKHEFVSGAVWELRGPQTWKQKPYTYLLHVIYKLTQ